ncbi:signal peptide peptidase SppA [Fuchsiella alkaliacetigena]|uniref:signal peptide peptidase SppA n=1 Tax=Fuchsiella alkaliacetigena TaxID=957042 RepID=UPI00200ABD45|nr:signal peptide peptidase SppA [Fuchsiella alkaliacetigena]MCK8825412.1 signal peptide peptidase SppA [Fuchsiella alkaliacetigena]
MLSLVLILISLLGIIIFKLLSKKLKSGSEIAVLDISGVMESGSRKSLLTKQCGVESILKEIKKLKEKDQVEAILLKINSPGGSAVAADNIYRQLQDFKLETAKPVVASMQDVAASGGYYVAMAADQVFANHSTLTGSIGVIMQLANLKGLFEKAGIKQETFKSGRFKDIGNAGREMTKEERELLNYMVQDVYEPFVKVVAQGRSLSEEEVRTIADGRLYTGNQALQADLVDQLGTFEEAIEYLKELEEVSDKAQVVEYGVPKLRDKLSSLLAAKLNLHIVPELGARYEFRP